MDDSITAAAYERDADRNLAKLADSGRLPYEAVATVAQAMATLAVSKRLEALYGLLAERLPR